MLDIDATAPGRRIKPEIYGVNFATEAVLRDLNIPLNRSGGNSASLYNWRIDARNAGADYYFESLPATSDIRDQFNHGFVARSRAGGSEPMITIPAIGWTARLGPDRAKLAAYSVRKYGPQQQTDFRYFPDAGNGVTPDGQEISGNDPHDAAEPVDAAAQAQARVQDLVTRWSRAERGGVRYYIVDNEPGLWHRTHRAVHPQGARAVEIADKTISVAKAIHRADPSARTIAPESWGWGGYLDSGFDQQAHAGHQDGAALDRATVTGGMDFLPWLLRRWRDAGAPVDVVSVHFYPQGGEFPDEQAGSRAIQLLRNRSTRLLWDSSYRDTSWIDAPVALIPRLRHWVDENYVPGTPIAITEYSWGGDDSMSGAVVQADIWGIFGREGVDMAARWLAPRPGTPVYRAMRLIRNYDGRDGAFGDISLPVTGADPDVLSAFAARRGGDKAVTLLVVNKSLDDFAAVAIKMPSGGPNRTPPSVYRLVKGELLPPRRISISGTSACDSLPPQSVALYVMPSADD